MVGDDLLDNKVMDDRIDLKVRKIKSVVNKWAFIVKLLAFIVILPAFAFLILQIL